MDINRLTQKSQEALQDAQTKALRYGHQEVDGEHLLLALLEQPEGLIPRLLAPHGRADRALEGRGRARARRAGPRSPARAPRRARSTSRSALQQLLVRAEDEAKRLKDEYVSVEHLLLALIDEAALAGRPDAAASTASPATRFLAR